MRIDFVSDVVCPWCAIGLWSLEAALKRTGVVADVHVQPFELNPQMPPEGENITEHLVAKYGGSPQQFAKTSVMIAARGAELGFTFDMAKRTTIYNTFDAHRLLHWAGLAGKDLALKRALLRAYHGEGKNVSDHATLVAVAKEVGLDPEGAGEVLRGNAYASNVREREQYYIDRGINGVPAVIIDEQHLISGGQPVAVFESALMQLSVG
jgi:predicted DsbA family dithiol-disulfide isomerase